jgi:hypothetical protein
MFVLVIKGRTTDATALRRQLDRWRSEVKPGAVGFLGSTVGIADDGTFIAVARFRGADDATANASRPEQGAWWDETVACFDGQPTFRESTDVTTIFEGPTTAAGFVQVIEGRASDRAKAEAFETGEHLAALREARPDLLGSLRVWFEDGSFVEAAHFTGESEARSGERAEAFSGPQQDYVALFGELTFVDLRDPLLD